MGVLSNVGLPHAQDNKAVRHREGMYVRSRRVLNLRQHVHLPSLPANPENLVRWESPSELARVIEEVSGGVIAARMRRRELSVERGVQILITRGCERFESGWIQKLEDVCVRLCDEVARARGRWRNSGKRSMIFPSRHVRRHSHRGIDTCRSHRRSSAAKSLERGEELAEDALTWVRLLSERKSRIAGAFRYLSFEVLGAFARAVGDALASGKDFEAMVKGEAIEPVVDIDSLRGVCRSRDASDTRTCTQKNIFVSYSKRRCTSV